MASEPDTCGESFLDGGEKKIASSIHPVPRSDGCGCGSLQGFILRCGWGVLRFQPADSCALPTGYSPSNSPMLLAWGLKKTFLEGGKLWAARRLGLW